MGVKYMKGDFEFPVDFGFHGSAGRVHVPTHSRAARGSNKSHIRNDEHGNDYAHGGAVNRSHIRNDEHSDDYAEGGHHKGHKKHAKGGRHMDGDEARDKAMVKKAVRQHENHEHGGKHTDLKLKGGGHAKHHAKGGTHINVKMPSRPPMVRPVRGVRPVAAPPPASPMAAPMGALNAGSSAIPQMSKGGHSRKRM